MPAGHVAFAIDAAVALAAAVRAAVYGAEAVGEAVAVAAAAVVSAVGAAVSVACEQHAAGVAAVDAGNAAAPEHEQASACRSPSLDCCIPLVAGFDRRSFDLPHILFGLNMGFLVGCSSLLPVQVNLEQDSAVEHNPKAIKSLNLVLV